MNIAEFITIPAACGLKPQIVLGDNRRKPIAWIPGGKQGGPYHLHAALAAIPRAAYVALTPGAFRSRTSHQHDEEPALYFLGWDYDTETREEGDVVARLLLALPQHFGVRRSAGGRGVHVYALFNRVVRVADPRRWVRQATKIVAGLYPPFGSCAAWLCKSDYRAFWFAPTDPGAALAPGAFEWLRVPSPLFNPTPLEARVVATPRPDPAPSEMVATSAAGIAADLLPLVTAITPLLGGGPVRGKHGVNVAAVRDALAGTRWAFKSKAKGRPEHRGEHNGFADIEPARVTIFSSPDGHPVLDVRSVEHWRGVLG